MPEVESERDPSGASVSGSRSLLAATLASLVASLVETSKSAAARAPALRKPAVLRRWLVKAHAAQIWLGVSLILLLFVLPPAYGAVTGWLFPPVASGGVTILGKQLGATLGPDARSESWRWRLLFVSWIAAGGGVGFLLFLSLPRGLSSAASVAKQKEDEADALLQSQPSKSIPLYQAALAVAVDRQQEAQLRGKIASLDRHISTTVAPLAGAAAADSHPSTPGLTLIKDVAAVGPDGRYRLVGELGRGGMGVVYIARDGVLDREVALKELPARLAEDASFAGRFRREARVLAKLSHPNIVQVFDFVEGGGRLWMAMEMMEGGDLDGLLHRMNKLPLPTALDIARPIAEALEFAHGRGIVHRDIKPANVLFTGTRVPKVTDFGLAKLVEEVSETGMQTQEGAILGSPRYMSPEQASGRGADARSDVYSFSVMVYRMVTGVLPFDGDTASLLAQHITQAPPSPRTIAPELPSSVEELLLRGLEKDPSKRIPAMTEMIAALSAISPSSARR